MFHRYVGLPEGKSSLIPINHQKNPSQFKCVVHYHFPIQTRIFQDLDAERSPTFGRTSQAGNMWPGKDMNFHGLILNHYFNMLNVKMKKNDAKCKEYLYSIKNDSSFRCRLLRGMRLYRILVLVLRPELIQQSG